MFHKAQMHHQSPRPTQTVKIDQLVFHAMLWFICAIHLLERQNVIHIYSCGENMQACTKIFPTFNASKEYYSYPYLFQQDYL